MSRFKKLKLKFVLFNDATGTHWFLSYHRLLDVIHMVTLTHFLEGNPQQGIFYMHFSIDRTVHTTAFDKPVVDHWLERKIAQTAAGSTEKDRSDDRPLQRRARYRLSYIPLPRDVKSMRRLFFKKQQTNKHINKTPKTTTKTNNNKTKLNAYTPIFSTLRFYLFIYYYCCCCCCVCGITEFHKYGYLCLWNHSHFNLFF